MIVFSMPVVLLVLMLMVPLLLAIALKPFQDLHAYLCNCEWVLHCGGGSCMQGGGRHARAVRGGGGASSSSGDDG